MNNPLLDFTGLPPFSAIQPDQVEAAVDKVLEENRQWLEDKLKDSPEDSNAFTWDSLIAPMMARGERFSRMFSPVRHLNAVMNSDELRDAYNACLPKISAYHTELGQNRALFKAVQAVAQGPGFKQFDAAQRKTIEDELRDFQLAGVDLPEAEQSRYKEIMQRLSELTSKFSNNVLDATNAWSLMIKEQDRLQGLPDTAIEAAQELAVADGEAGAWKFTLDFPSYQPLMTYADDQNLREEVYRAFATRASDQGPHAGQFDNGPLMNEILALRQEASELLGFNNYAERSIATKMARTTDEVLDFLNDMANKAKPVAEQEMAELRAFAKEQHGIEDLQAWDIAYYGEKLRQDRYAISQEEIRPYFPAPQVIEGMFEVVKRLYGLNIRSVDAEAEGIELWHPDASFHEIRDADDELRGQFYLDLYARKDKRGGAWMDECITRQKHTSGIDTPVAYLTCNFSAPTGGKPALLTHSEVETLFHEFGHGLHHMLTRIDWPSVSGINGVEWDAVELPSQFMENWCWEREALDLFAAHYQTGERIPDDLYKRMRAAQHFQTGMQTVRQMEFALFDFRMHKEYTPDMDIMGLLNEVRAQVSVVPTPDFNRFPNAFGHIFAGGYAAGYYSYKWAEVLSADAFGRFEEDGIFNADTGKAFLTEILEMGGSRPALASFTAFRGREPDIEPLLRQTGLAA